MQQVRQTVIGPIATQRPPALFFVTATGVCFDIDAGVYTFLKDAIRAGKPLLMTAEGANIYYRWSASSTLQPGETIGAVATTPTGSAAVLFSGQNPERLEVAPDNTKGLIVMTPTAGQTGILRIWAGS